MIIRPPAHQVTIANTGETFSCPEAAHLLAGMATLGRKGIPSGCHGGGCGVCKIKVESGRYRTEAMSRAHVSEAEEREGIVLACRVRPLSDLTVTVVGKLAKTAGQRKKYGFV